MSWKQRLTSEKGLLGLPDAGEERPVLEVPGSHISTIPKIITGSGEIEDIKTLLQGQVVGLDYETTSKRAVDSTLVGVGVALRDGRSWYIPCGHRIPGETEEIRETTYRGNTHNKDGERYTRKKRLRLPWKICDLAERQLPPEEVYDFLRWLFVSVPQIICHNAKYEMLCSHTWLPDLEVTAEIDDSMIADWLVMSSADPTINHGLKSAVWREFAHKMTTFADVTKGNKNKQIALADINESGYYCCDDAYQCLRLWDHHQCAIDRTDLRKDYDRIEKPILDLLIRMELAGVVVDPGPLEDLHVYVCKEMKIEQAKADKFCGGPVELGSPKQVSELVYNILEFQDPKVKAGKSGQLPVNKHAMKWWSEHGTEREKEFADIKVRWSELETLRARFTSTLLDLVSEDGRIRSNNKQTGTETGRFSMSDPNLQNIPSRGKLGKKTRMAFRAAPGMKMVVADYSQLEPRVMAHYSHDPALIDVYENDRDIYKHLIALMAEKTGIQRSRDDGKTLVLAMNYGMAVPTLAKALNVSKEEAKTIYDAFFETCAGVVSWKHKTIKQAREDGYVLTLAKRRRYIPDLTLYPFCHTKPEFGCKTCWKCKMRREKAARQAVNTIIQGTAADIVKLAMRNIDAKLDPNHGRILWQVHDEIILEIRNKYAEDVARMVKHEMETVVSLRVPLKTEPAIATSWGECK